MRIWILQVLLSDDVCFVSWKLDNFSGRKQGSCGNAALVVIRGLLSVVSRRKTPRAKSVVALFLALRRIVFENLIDVPDAVFVSFLLLLGKVVILLIHFLLSRVAPVHHRARVMAFPVVSEGT